MRTALMLVLLVGLCVCATGCLTAQQQARLNELTATEKSEIEKLVAERLAAYDLIEDQTKDVKVKIEAGSLTVDDGKKYIELLTAELMATKEKVEDQIKDTKEAFEKEREKILESGKSKAEYWGGIALAMVVEFLGVNYYRSRKHPLTKEIA